MSDFAGMEDLMQDFLIESSGLLSEIDDLLLRLESNPNDSSVFNVIFRNFHTIKGGAGFLNATALVELCHLAEGLFDKLRNGELALDAKLMAVTHAVMKEVRQMFGSLAENMQPATAPAASLMAQLNSILEGERAGSPTKPAVMFSPSSAPLRDANNPDWNVLYQSLASPSDTNRAPAHPPPPHEQPPPNTPIPAFDRTGRRATDIGANKAGSKAHRKTDTEKDSTIRVDADRLNQVLSLSDGMAEIKNNLAYLLRYLEKKQSDSAMLDSLDESINQIDALAKKLRNAIVRTHMQPIGRIFSKYKLLVDDLSLLLNKRVEVVLAGEETELDTNVIDQLNEPLVHLLRNALIHGIEDTIQRLAVGKPRAGLLYLGARQEESHIIITVTDDGKGMAPESIRARAIEQGLIDAESANRLGKNECLNLVFLPGFSPRTQALSNIGNSGGLSIAQAGIKKLGGTISLDSELGSGCEFTITLPLKLGLLQVRQLRLNDKLLAVPSSLVRGVLPISQSDLQQISGQTIMLVHGEAMRVLPLSRLIGWEEMKPPELGVHIQFGSNNLILAVDGDAGQNEVAFKSIDTLCPKGVAGTSLSSTGKIVLILDVRELLADKLG